jgi:hypothetical protein
MTKRLEEALEMTPELSEADQDEAAEMLLSVAVRNTAPIRLDDETREAISEGRGQAWRGGFVSDDDMAGFSVQTARSAPSMSMGIRYMRSPHTDNKPLRSVTERTADTVSGRSTVANSEGIQVGGRCS